MNLSQTLVSYNLLFPVALFPDAVLHIFLPTVLEQAEIVKWDSLIFWEIYRGLFLLKDAACER